MEIVPILKKLREVADVKDQNFQVVRKALLVVREAILNEDRSFEFWSRQFHRIPGSFVRVTCLHAMENIEKTYKQQLEFEKLVRDFRKVLRYRPVYKMPPDEGGSSFTLHFALGLFHDKIALSRFSPQLLTLNF